MDKPVRVLHVLQRMEPAGVQTLLMSLYREVDRSKVQFDFLVHYKTPQFFDEEIEKLGGKIYRFPVREDFNFIKYKRDLNKFFREHTEYKVVHGHMHSLGAIYLNAAQKNSVPVRIAHSHTNNTQSGAKKSIKQFMCRRYADHATELFACSQSAGKYMFGDRPFKVINNAIDSKRFEFRQEVRDEKRRELGVENKLVIGSVGRFSAQKNQIFTVNVFEKLLKKRPDAVLLLIGKGAMEDEVKALVKEKNLDSKVMFLGHRRDVDALYQAMDVFMFPSLFEGLGIVGVEAQAAGTPVVCTDTLPKEIDITPLLHRISLSAPVEQWVEEIEKASEDSNKQKPMTDFFVKAEYDVKALANWLQDFYLSKY